MYELSSALLEEGSSSSSTPPWPVALSLQDKVEHLYLTISEKM